MSESTSSKKNLRLKGLSILKLFMKEFDADKLNQKIASMFPDNERYINTIYNLYGMKDSYKEGIQHLENLYDCSIYESFRKEQQDKDDFITNPFSVEEGVMECMKCNSKKTYSTQKQVRSADEGFTTFCYCLNCGAKWRIN
jgi:DNA-directed RNA polymerase subunit M/transcription elongation factor TFIIS